MIMSERRLRQIIRETLLEEQYRIDESSHRMEEFKSMLKAAALSAGVVLSASQLVDMASNMMKAPASQELPYESSHTYTSPINDQSLEISAGEKLKGEKLISFVLAHHENIPEKDLNDVAKALGEYNRPGHSSIGASRRHRHNDAINIIKNRIESSEVTQTDQMYSVGRSTR